MSAADRSSGEPTPVALHESRERATNALLQAANAECQLLRASLEQARRTQFYWKAEHLAANEENESLRASLRISNSNDPFVRANKAIHDIMELRHRGVVIASEAKGRGADGRRSIQEMRVELVRDALDDLSPLSERQTTDRIGEIVAQIKAMGGCTNGDCFIAPPRGAHTNDHCRCAEDRTVVRHRLVLLYQTVAPPRE